MIYNKYMVDSSNRVTVVSLNDATALDSLPAQVYTVNHHPMMGFSLMITKELLSVPPKIYGNAMRRVNKCIKTYSARDAATGILLTGDKGTGKSVVMSLLANTAITELGLPVVLVKDAHHGEAFDSFIQSLGEIVLVFDEVGKLYSNDSREGGVQQETLLPLLDGIDKTKRMTIMTENSESDISDYILNRPSRVYYHFKYRKLEESSILDYCEDHNVREEVSKDIIDLSRRSRIFSFDMLQTIVEEHKRFNESIEVVTEELNVEIREEYDTQMEIIKIFNTETKEEYELAQPSPMVFKPVYGYTYIRYRVNEPTQELSADEAYLEGLSELHEIEEAETGKKPDNTLRNLHFSSEDLVYESAGNLVYEEEGITVVAKELPRRSYKYYDLF